MLRKLLVLLIFIAVPALASAQPVFVTGNQYVWAEVDSMSGLIWFGAGPVANHVIGDGTHELSAGGQSWLDVMLNDTEYQQQADGITSKIADTIQTIWQRNGVDIIQNVYPVEFGISGTIVLSIEIVNHRATAIVAQAQYLLREAVDGFESAEEAHSLVRYPRAIYRGEADECIVYPDSLVGPYPVPPFFISYIHVNGQKTFFGDLIGVGYLSDSSAPLPLGLINPSQLVIGDFTIGDSWGIPGLGFPFNGQYPMLDQRKQIQWPPDTISGTGKDSIAVIARMCYGTGDIDVCSGEPPNTGPLIVLTMYPHLLRTPGGKPTPNKFRVETMIFGDTGKKSSATLSVSAGQSIVAPRPVSNGGASQTQALNLAALQNYNDFYDFQWTDSVFAISNSSISLGVTIFDSTYGHQTQACSLPIIMTPYEKAPTPIGKIISRSGSYDGSDCNARCTEVVAYDTGIIRIPILSVKDEKLLNMSLTIAPNHDGSDSIYYTLCVIDSMQNGSATISITDSLGNFAVEQYSYCTIPDTHAPWVQFLDIFDSGPSIYQYQASDTQAWDRGLDTIYFTNVSNTMVGLEDSVHGLGIAYFYAYGPHGSFCVTVIDLAGNKFDTCFSIGAPAVVSDYPSAPLMLSILPNPSSGDVTIFIEGASSAEVEVFDVLGHEVDRFSVAGSYDWHTSGLLAGTYILRATTGGNSQPVTKRIVKE